MIENQGRKICFYVVRLELPPSLAGMLSSGATAVGCHNALELKHFAFLFEDCWFFPKDVKQKGKKAENKTKQASAVTAELPLEKEHLDWNFSGTAQFYFGWARY